MPILSRLRVLLAVLLAAGALGGCGNKTKVATERFIYTSSEDCAAGAKIQQADCDKAVEKALLEHDKLTIKYPTLADCDKAEGPERCERVADRHFRPRLMGFLFSVNEQVAATPLYAIQVVQGKSATLYRDAGGATYDWERTEGITFSRAAIRKAEGFTPLKKGRS